MQYVTLLHEIKSPKFWVALVRPNRLDFCVALPEQLQISLPSFSLTTCLFLLRTKPFEMLPTPFFFLSFLLPKILKILLPKLWIKLP